MPGKVIRFPKHKKSPWYYFREYYHVIAQIVAAWSLVMFAVIYLHWEQPDDLLAVLCFVWFAGLVWMFCVTYLMGRCRITNHSHETHPTKHTLAYSKRSS